MKKIETTDPRVINAILGAAILGGMAEQGNKPNTETENAPDHELDRALLIRKQYEAFISVGFTEAQATAFITAILS